MESFREDFIMAISYKRLWKMLIDKMEEYFKSKNCEYIVVDVFSYN